MRDKVTSVKSKISLTFLVLILSGIAFYGFRVFRIHKLENELVEQLSLRHVDEASAIYSALIESKPSYLTSNIELALKICIDNINNFEKMKKSPTFADYPQTLQYLRALRMGLKHSTKDLAELGKTHPKFEKLPAIANSTVREMTQFELTRLSPARMLEVAKQRSNVDPHRMIIPPLNRPKK